MNLKDWLKDDKTRKTNMADGICVAYDIDGSPLGEVEYRGGRLIRRTKYLKNKESNKLIIIGIIFFLCFSSFAEGSVDWGKLEGQLYSDLRKTQGIHSDAELEQAMGYMLIKNYNQPDRAAVHFKKAVKLDSKLFNSFYSLGIIYIGSEKGNGYFKQAIKANPNYPPPYYWLAYNYCKNRKDKEAIPILKKYIAISVKSDPNEVGRIKFAKGLLAELNSGKEGEELKEIRE